MKACSLKVRKLIEETCVYSWLSLWEGRDCTSIETYNEIGMILAYRVTSVKNARIATCTAPRYARKCGCVLTNMNKSKFTAQKSILQNAESMYEQSCTHIIKACRTGSTLWVKDLTRNLFLGSYCSSILGSVRPRYQYWMLINAPLQTEPKNS
jgi:hypothetical protein